MDDVLNISEKDAREAKIVTILSDQDLVREMIAHPLFPIKRHHFTAPVAPWDATDFDAFEWHMCYPDPKMNLDYDYEGKELGNNWILHIVVYEDGVRKGIAIVYNPEELVREGNVIRNETFFIHMIHTPSEITPVEDGVHIWVIPHTREQRIAEVARCKALCQFMVACHGYTYEIGTFLRVEGKEEVMEEYRCLPNCTFFDSELPWFHTHTYDM
jgi:hypothetical protein